MAYIKTKPIRTKGHLEKGIDYWTQLQKTDNGKLIYGWNLITTTPQDIYDQFIELKQHFQKEDGRQAYQLIMSFVPGETDPETAHKIAIEFAQKVLTDWQVLVVTHTDEPQLNSHLIINSVSPVTGLKFRDEKDGSTLQWFRCEANKLCKKYRLSIIREITPEEKTPRSEKAKTSYSELKPKTAQKETARSVIYADFDAAIQQATSLDNFFEILQRDMGYETKRGKNVSHTAVKPPGRENFFRLYKFLKGYTEEDIAERIALRLEGKGDPYKKKDYVEDNYPEVGQTFIGHIAPAFFRGGRRTDYQVYRISVLRYARYFNRHTHFNLQTTYLQYRYVLRRVQRQTYPRYAGEDLRNDVKKLNQFSEETMFLVKNDIQTLGQMESYQAALKENISTNYKAIRKIDRALKESKSEMPLEERKELEQKRAALKAKVAPLMHEKKVCERIANKSDRMQKQIAIERKESEAMLERNWQEEKDQERSFEV